MATILDKIQALITKARDEACSEAEAEACMTRARKLMEQHGVEEGELREADGVDEQVVEVKYLEPWRKILVSRVASYYGCAAMFYGGEKKYLLVGRQASRSVARSMAEWLDETIVRLAREWRRAEGRSRGDQLNFERACAARICERLREMNDAARKGGEGGGTELVLVREQEEAERWLGEKYSVGTTQARSRVGGAGAAAGREAGGRVGLSGQVGAGGRGGGVLALR
jgi:hypothetical protein